MASLLAYALSFLFLTTCAVSARPASDGLRMSAGLAAPLTCSRIECPEYDVMAVGNGYEIRRLFEYIQGKNEYCAKIEMTAPVLTQVTPSDGPLCESSFVVSFFVPKFYQGNPPPAKGIHTQKWSVKYVAVKQFGGFVSDDTVAQEAASLYSSLAGSTWATAVDNARKADSTSAYAVAQYNSPFEFTDRVNEIWLPLAVQPKNST